MLAVLEQGKHLQVIIDRNNLAMVRNDWQGYGTEFYPAPNKKLFKLSFIQSRL